MSATQKYQWIAQRAVYCGAELARGAVLLLLICILQSSIVSQASAQYNEIPEIDPEVLNKYFSEQDSTIYTRIASKPDSFDCVLHDYNWTYEHETSWDSYSTSAFIRYPQIVEPVSRPAIDSINASIKRTFLYETTALQRPWESMWSNELSPEAIREAKSREQEAASESDEDEEHEAELLINVERNSIDFNFLSAAHDILTVELINNYFYDRGRRSGNGDYAAFLTYDLNTGRKLNWNDLILSNAQPIVNRLIRQQLRGYSNIWSQYEDWPQAIPVRHFFLTQDLLVLIIATDKPALDCDLPVEFPYFDMYHREVNHAVILPLDRIREYLNINDFPALTDIRPHKKETRVQSETDAKIQQSKVLPFPLSLWSKWTESCDKPQLVSEADRQQWEDSFADTILRAVQFTTADRNSTFRASFTHSGRLDSLYSLWTSDSSRGQLHRRSLIVFNNAGSNMFAGNTVTHLRETAYVSRDRGAEWDIMDDYILGLRVKLTDSEVNVFWRKDSTTRHAQLIRGEGPSSIESLEVFNANQDLFSDLETPSALPMPNMRFDSNGRLIEAVYTCDGEAQLTTFQYDDNGLLQSINNEIQVLYEYW